MQRSRMLQVSVKALVAIGAAAALVHGSAALASEPARLAVRRGAALFSELERKDVEQLSKALDALVADPALLEPFRARDRAKLLAAALPRFEKLKAERNITHLYFHEPARTCFLRVHAPALHGDVIDRETLSQAIATQLIGAGKELGKTAFALRVVKPVRSKGKVVGYVELGEEIDHFLSRMKQLTGDDYGLLVDKSRVDRKELARVRGDDRWDERPDVVLIDSTIWDERNIGVGASLASLPDEGGAIVEWKEGARSFAGSAFPVRDAGKHVVGALFVRHPIVP